MGSPEGWADRKGQGAVAQALEEWDGNGNAAGGLGTGTGCSLSPATPWDGTGGQPASSAWTDPQPWFSS